MYANRFFYLCALSVCIAFLILNDTAATFAAFYIVAAVPVVSFVWALYSVRRFRFDETLSNDTITKGDEIQYRFSAENKAAFPLTRVRVVFGASSPTVETDMAEQLFFLDAHSSKTLSFNAVCAMRGVFEIGIVELSLYDYLGIFRFRIKAAASLTVRVLPRVVTLHSFPLDVRESVTDDVIRFLGTEDVTAVSDLREYRPSDSLKRVHWGATAKRNEFIVKNYQTIAKSPVLLCVNNRVGAGKDDDPLVLEDLIVETVIAVADYCDRLRFPVSFITPETPLNGVTAEGFADIFSAVSDLKFGCPENDFSYMIQAAESSDDINIVLFSQEVSPPLIKTLRTIRLTHKNVIVLSIDFESNKGLGLIPVGLADQDIKFAALTENDPIFNIGELL